MFSATELADMQATAAETLVDSGTIRRPTKVADGAGGYTETTADTGPYDCLLMPANTQAQLELVAQGIKVVCPYVIRFEAGRDVRADDQVLIGARTFEVKAPLKGGAMELVRRVACVEIT